MGLGWDTNCDIDASVIMLDAAGTKVDHCAFDKLTSNCGSVRHSGDNLDGAGDGDDEVITVHLN